jgi:putative oxidoreductase
MKTIFQNKWLLLVLRILIGGLFIYAAVPKIRNPLAFADSIETFRLLPPELINLLALTLPPLEIILGVFLIIGWKQRVIAFSILILTIVFALGLVQGLARGLVIDCGCFGSGEPSVWKTWISLGRDLVLMAATWIVYRQARSSSEASPQS